TERRTPAWRRCFSAWIFGDEPAPRAGRVRDAVGAAAARSPCEALPRSPGRRRAGRVTGLRLDLAVRAPFLVRWLLPGGPGRGGRRLRPDPASSRRHRGDAPPDALRREGGRRRDRRE